MYNLRMAPVIHSAHMLLLSSVSGEDHSEWLHHPGLSGGVDSAGEIRGDGVSSGGGAFPREGGAFGTCGVLCRQLVHKVQLEY